MTFVSMSGIFVVALPTATIPSHDHTWNPQPRKALRRGLWINLTEVPAKRQCISKRQRRTGILHPSLTLWIHITFHGAMAKAYFKGLNVKIYFFCRGGTSLRLTDCADLGTFAKAAGLRDLRWLFLIEGVSKARLFSSLTSFNKVSDT